MPPAPSIVPALKSQRDAVFRGDGVERFAAAARRGVGVAEQDLLRRRACICEMMPVARTLQESVELRGGSVLVAVVEHDTDHGRRAVGVIGSMVLDGVEVLLAGSRCHKTANGSWV